MMGGEENETVRTGEAQQGFSGDGASRTVSDMRSVNHYEKTEVLETVQNRKGKCDEPIF